MTDHGTPSAGVDGAVPAGPGDPDGREPVLRRVGPGGLLASDHAFGVALVTLWHRVAQTGPAAGFADGVDRGQVARLVPPLVDELRTGRSLGFAVNAGRLLVGAALLRPGPGAARHTATVPLLLTDPDHLRSGIGSELLGALLTAATDAGVDRVEVAVDPDQAGFFLRRGFTEWGRRPGWRRHDPAADQGRDELLMGWTA